jgi:phospholipase/carboxylesterase
VLDAIEIETGPHPTWTVLWLHGLGADGHDFEPLVPQLVRKGWPALRFIFPHAPVRPVTINGGMRMRAWYDIVGTEIANRQDEVGVRDSIAKVEQLIAREAVRGIASHRVILAGFSQGGAIALATAVRHPAALGGVVALSTYLPLGDRTEAERTAVSQSSPIWFAHGSADPVVPHALGQMSRDWLIGLGYGVEWHSYPMPHSLCAEEVTDLATWLGMQFDKARPHA